MPISAISAGYQARLFTTVLKSRPREPNS